MNLDRPPTRGGGAGGPGGAGEGKKADPTLTSAMTITAKRAASPQRSRGRYRRSWDGTLIRELPANPPRDWPTIGGTTLRLLAAIVIPLALSLDRPLAFVLTTGSVVVFGLAPVWLPPFLRAPGGAPLVAATGLVLVTGFVLAWVSQSDHAVSTGVGLTSAITIATFLGGVGAMWWSSRVIGIHWVVLLFAGALLLQVLANPTAWQQNPWKFGFSAPVALLVITLADRFRSTLLALLGLAALGLYSVLNDSRSVFAMFLVTGLVLLYQRLRRNTPRKPSNAAFVLGGIGIGAFLYYTLTTLIVSGALGAGLKQRSEAQLESSGSLLLGGRPEWTVTLRLMQERPWGFGFGVTPSEADVELGRQGFASIHLLSQENYLYNYVFDAIFRLHSITADLWAASGFAGIVLVLVMLWLIVTSMAEQLALRTCTGILVYLAVRSIWDIGFSPIYTALPGVALTLAVALAARTKVREDREAEERALADAAGLKEWRPPTLTSAIPVIKPVEGAP